MSEQNAGLSTDDNALAGGDGEKSPVFNEVSIIARQLLLGSFDRLLPKDDTLLTRGGGSQRGLMLYDELERDPKVWETLQKRKMALTSRPWKVEPPEGDTSRKAKYAADMVSEQLKQLDFDQLTNTQLDATLKGISTGEVMWAKDGNEIVAEDVLDVEPWLFQFKLKPDPDEYTFARCGVRLVTRDNPNLGDKVPHRKFMIHRFGAKYNNPWGLGLGTRLFWPVFFKRQGIQFWLSFAERFGTPVPIGKYPNNATPVEKATLRSALRAFVQEASIMVPQGMEIDLLEAARSGIDTYEKLCRYMDDAVAGIVMGKAGGAGSGGQLAAAAILENEVRLEVVRADGNLLSGTHNKQLVRWIIDYNMPGAPYPRVCREVDEPKDIAAMAATKKILFDMGYKPTLESIKEDFGGDYIEIKSPAANGSDLASSLDSSALRATSSAEFSEPMAPADQVAVDALLSSLSQDKLQSIMESVLAPVIKAVRESGDQQAALEKLVEIFPTVPLDELQQSLARVFFALDTWGRLNAAVEQA